MQHSFDVEIAEKYGVNCAIILNNLQFWIAKNKANGTNFHDGRFWTFNSMKAFSELFPYMTSKQIRGALDTLRDEGLLITGNYNVKPYDRTLWYALTEKGECICPTGQMEMPNKANGNAPQGTPIPDINTDTKTTDINTDGITPSASAPSKPVRHKYGMYKNVLLSDEDMEKLKAEFPADWEQRIERLSEYIESKGAKYRNHLATIRAWARKDKDKNVPTNNESEMRKRWGAAADLV